jgi:flagellar basal-body rod protein FlgF
MDTPAYTALSRQQGLFREMSSVANNIANAATTGYRREGLIFAEMVEAAEVRGGSISMTSARGRMTSDVQGTLTLTGGPLDVAIEGEGFFAVETPGGPRLTRAGAFSQDADGLLVTADGHAVLDAGGAPVFIPSDSGPVAIAPDGTVSAGGQPVGQIGLFTVAEPQFMAREGQVMFVPDSELLPSQTGTMKQGFLESSNVNPVSEIARMIMVQRQYELGQQFLSAEDDRIRGVIRTLG